MSKVRKKYQSYSEADPHSRTSDDPRRQAQFWLLTALYEVMKKGSITQKELSELLDEKLTRVQVWFFQHETARRTLPTIMDLRQMFKLQWPRVPLSSHGRAFNYVWMFEEKPLTDYEERLREENARLREQLTEKEQALKVLRKEYHDCIKKK